jgi:6-pyruvoyltetrahydropterin/6-carboxytetrahydropterin synthase
VTVGGELDTKTGLIVDVVKLDQVVQETIVNRFDHQHLNFDPAFQNLTTTGENLARLIWELLVDRVPSGQLENVRVVETRDNFFDYVGDPKP